jgi:hypothetical protein
MERADRGRLHAASTPRGWTSQERYDFFSAIIIRKVTSAPYGTALAAPYWRFMRRSRSAKRGSERGGSLQLRVFRFGLLEDWNIGIGIFPRGEKILVGNAGFGVVTLGGIGAA